LAALITNALGLQAYGTRWRTSGVARPNPIMLFQCCLLGLVHRPGRGGRREKPHGGARHGFSGARHGIGGMANAFPSGSSHSKTKGSAVQSNKASRESRRFSRVNTRPDGLPKYYESTFRRKNKGKDMK